MSEVNPATTLENLKNEYTKLVQAYQQGAQQLEQWKQTLLKLEGAIEVLTQMVPQPETVEPEVVPEAPAE